MSWGGGSINAFGGTEETLSVESLVVKVKELQRSDLAAKEEWGRYTGRHGQGTRDPSKHTAEFLQGFLDSYTSGAGFPAGLGGPISPAWGGGGGGDDSVETLVARVKELQRNNVHAKEQWIAYTDLNGAGTRDPSKHTAEFLQGFLDHQNSGHHIMPQAAAGMHENPSLPEAFKMLQKKSENFKTIWKQFCAQQGGGKFDPTKHDTAFHLYFLEHIASLASGGSGSSRPMPMMGASDAPFKRMRDSSGMGVSTGHSGDAMKDALVNQVKVFQRMGTEQKELWATYADTYLGGARDPARHDASTLHEFCVNHEVPEVSAPPSFGGMSAPMRPAAAASGGMGMPATMDPHKDGLVQRVKIFQKAARENAETWGSFCGSTRDPGRHSVEKLQEFIKLFGVP